MAIKMNFASKTNQGVVDSAPDSMKNEYYLVIRENEIIAAKIQWLMMRKKLQEMESSMVADSAPQSDNMTVSLEFTSASVSSSTSMAYSKSDDKPQLTTEMPTNLELEMAHAMTNQLPSRSI